MTFFIQNFLVDLLLEVDAANFRSQNWFLKTNFHDSRGHNDMKIGHVVTLRHLRPRPTAICGSTSIISAVRIKIWQSN